MPEYSLTSDGVVHRPYSNDLRAKVKHAAKAWKEFVSLPDEEKRRYSADETLFSAGYERKFGERDSDDKKENFDFSQVSLDKLSQLDDVPQSAKQFFNAAEALASLLGSEIEDYGHEIADATGVEAMTSIATRSRNNYFLRFLHYPPITEGSTVGEPHTDHSGLTFHLYESTEGCRALSPREKIWRPLPVSETEIIAFGGMQLQLATQGKVTALCHDIVANSTTALDGRFAIVCFTRLEGVPNYDKTRHGRLQEREPGFNYGLSHQEFSQLFTQD